MAITPRTRSAPRRLADPQRRRGLHRQHAGRRRHPEPQPGGPKRDRRSAHCLGAVFNLAFSGSDTVGSLYLNGVAKGPGTYDAGNSGGYITGGGSLSIIPEPGTLALLATGLLGLLAYAWRKRGNAEQKH